MQQNIPKNMKTLLSVVLLLASLYAEGVYSYTVGAPIYACDALAPIPIAHNGPPQTTTVPYTIDLSSFNNNGELQYNPEESYTLTLSGIDGQLFKGFLVQARLVADAISHAGIFGVSDNINSQLSACSRATAGITHTTSSNKSSVTFTWTAPPEGTGPIRFGFTVVEVREIYWANERTEMLTESGSGAAQLSRFSFWTVLLVALGVALKYY